MVSQLAQKRAADAVRLRNHKYFDTYCRPRAAVPKDPDAVCYKPENYQNTQILRRIMEKMHMTYEREKTEASRIMYDASAYAYFLEMATWSAKFFGEDCLETTQYRERAEYYRGRTMALVAPSPSQTKLANA